MEIFRFEFRLILCDNLLYWSVNKAKQIDVNVEELKMLLNLENIESILS